MSNLDNLNVETCNNRLISKGKIVCVCDTSSCHDLLYSWPQQSGETDLIESSQSGKRFKVSSVDSLSNDIGHDHSGESDQVDVDLNVRHQTILGWGGSFTDSAILNMKSLGEDLSTKLMASYYGENGLQYNFGRVPIGGSDFSTRAYSYDNQTDDYELSHWKLTDEDLELKIPMIKLAMKLLKEAGNDQLKLIASPWSPPEWMKTSKSLVRGRLIKDDKVYSSYANYLMKFYDAYEAHGIKFWGATVQNEPVASFLPFYGFNSLQFTSSDMIEFVGRFLGPALVKRGMTKDNFKLMVGDDSLGLINLQVPAVMRDKEVQKYVSGLAFHWYTSGLLVPYSALTRVYNQIKDHIEFVIMTEACSGSPPSLKKVDLGSWSRGESYTTDIIEDLHRHTGAWIDWNFALDLGGGPNWAGNFVDSPILVDSSRGEFYKQPMYYALAHFSRFFRPNSVRVESSVKAKQSGLSAVAAIKEDSGHVVVNLLNKSDKDRSVELKIGAGDGLTSRTFSIEARSFNTVVLKL